MKVLYVASNPTDASELDLDREITELQKRSVALPDEPVSFRFLPDLNIEDLPGQLSSIKPDVLHLAAHGDSESLSLSDETNHPVYLTANILRSFLSPDHPPRLIYLNACNSNQIARDLVGIGSVPMAIGSTAPITNRAARPSAVAFHERLLAGLSVARAFDACKHMLEALADSKASAELHTGSEIFADTEILYRVPTLVADFQNGRPRKARDNHYKFRLGLQGCPACTTQVIFFTDDESFISDEDELENDLCIVVRGTPVSGVVWAPEEYDWKAEGDHRLFAVGVKAEGGGYAVASTLCEAIENRYLLAPDTRGIPKNVGAAIRDLRRNDGAEVNPAVWDPRSLPAKGEPKRTSKRNIKKATKMVGQRTKRR